MSRDNIAIQREYNLAIFQRKATENGVADRGPEPTF